MTYMKPDQLAESMVQMGAAKAKLPIQDLLIRGTIAGALLGAGTTLAFTAEVQTQLGIIGALLFPACFVIVILLGLELVTGNFALVPLAVMEKEATIKEMVSNFFWVILGHLIGAILYASLYIVSLTHLGAIPITESPIAQKLIHVAEAKTLAYAALGSSGLLVVFIKAMLCNWLVCLGVVIAMTSMSVGGKIAAMWLPILIFFAQGFEHAVVNMFVIPAGMMLGAEVTVGQWLIWNQVPVLAGNFVGGLLFTGIAIYVTHRRTEGTAQVINERHPAKKFNGKSGMRTEKEVESSLQKF
ncbi:formate/nitrite transporter family protein [Planococcus donghaensis]|uniref:formate/nitrite transporter family protein n=1 Tax=Planococcus donghaensis TaxID=414778 RepID=UPI003737009E